MDISPDREENFTETNNFTPCEGGRPTNGTYLLEGGGAVRLFSGFPQTELRELIASVDLIIAPSLAEGFGSVHSEACAMGKTLLTTQVSAIPEVVSGKVKFVQAGSSEAIVQGIKEVRAGNVEDIPQKRFNRDETVEKIEKLYL
jgi:glycosyltransferase involved in cell wall biosynthesis